MRHITPGEGTRSGSKIRSGACAGMGGRSSQAGPGGSQSSARFTSQRELGTREPHRAGGSKFKKGGKY